MRKYYESVHIESREDGAPHRVIWRGRLYRVLQIEERWLYCGKWWLDGRGWRRKYYRVLARSSHHPSQVTMELYQQDRLWTLCGICD